MVTVFTLESFILQYAQKITKGTNHTEMSDASNAADSFGNK